MAPPPGALQSASAPGCMSSAVTAQGRRGPRQTVPSPPSTPTRSRRHRPALPPASPKASGACANFMRGRPLVSRWRQTCGQASGWCVAAPGRPWSAATKRSRNGSWTTTTWGSMSSSCRGTPISKRPIGLAKGTFPSWHAALTGATPQGLSHLTRSQEGPRARRFRGAARAVPTGCTPRPLKARNNPAPPP